MHVGKDAVGGTARVGREVVSGSVELGKKTVSLGKDGVRMGINTIEEGSNVIGRLRIGQLGMSTIGDVEGTSTTARRGEEIQSGSSGGRADIWGIGTCGACMGARGRDPYAEKWDSKKPGGSSRGRDGNPPTAAMSGMGGSSAKSRQQPQMIPPGGKESTDGCGLKKGAAGEISTWCHCDESNFIVRGKHYLKDGVKVEREHGVVMPCACVERDAHCVGL